MTNKQKSIFNEIVRRAKNALDTHTQPKNRPAHIGTQPLIFCWPNEWENVGMAGDPQGRRIKSPEVPLRNPSINPNGPEILYKNISCDDDVMAVDVDKCVCTYGPKIFVARHKHLEIRGESIAYDPSIRHWIRKWKWTGEKNGEESQNKEKKKEWVSRKM